MENINIRRLKKELLTVLIIIQLFWPLVTTCRCAIKHPQQLFCTSNYVMTAKVEEVTLNYVTQEKATELSPLGSLATVTYYVQVHHVYRFERGKGRRRSIPRRTKIHTPGSLYDCRASLQKDKTYIISGDVRGRKLWVNSCDWVQNMATMTYSQKMGLMKLYEKNCRCQVKCCTGSQCKRKKSARHRNMCRMDTGIFSCYTNYGICEYEQTKGQRGCSWKSNPDIDRCLTTHGYQSGLF
ncbi:metalloproteinase inhibitor 3-like [Argopecten irradians]|uniref:metalloproteinase inhibitor 3-like n=1 Tax=Argopecten irradians TaxID=31199 RepID=UPI00372087A4